MSSPSPVLSSKKTREELLQSGGKQLLITTGGKIDEITMALVTHFDGDPQVRDAVGGSLYDIGRRKPELVLSSILDFLVKNPKAPIEQRVSLLRCVHQILELKRDQLSEDLCMDMVGLAMAEMHRERDVMADWQGAASALLVSLGMRFPRAVMEELMKKFSPGMVPHYFVMKTLGDFANANANDIVPMLKEIFARATPVLSSIKADNMKWVFASSIGYFCDAVVQYVANHPNEAGSGGSSWSFHSEVFPAFEVMFNNWLPNSKELRVRVATVQSLGHMCAVLERVTFEAQLPRVMNTALQMLRSEREIQHQLALVEGLAVMLECAVRQCAPVLITLPAGASPSTPTLLAQIFATLHTLVCQFQQQQQQQTPQTGSGSSQSLAAAAVTDVAAASLKIQNELLRCFEILTRAYPDQTFALLLKTLENRDGNSRCASLRMLRHVVTRLDEVISEDKKRAVLSGVLPLIQQEKQRRVRKLLAETTIAMASKSYLLLEGGQAYVEFVLRNAAIADAEVQSFDPRKAADDPVSPAELRAICDDILRLFATTLPHMHRALWPYLLEHVCKPQFTDALAVICKCLALIATQKRARNDADYLINFERAVNVPRAQAIVARFIVLLNSPHRRGQLGVQLLEALRGMGPVLHPSLPAMFDNALPKLVALLAPEKRSEFSQQHWEELLLRLQAEILKISNDDEWNKTLGDYLGQQLELYRGESELKKCALKLLGLTLQKLSHKEFIRARLDMMFAAVDHAGTPTAAAPALNVEIERLGLAQGFGFCAAVHFDAVLERLEDLLKRAPQESEGLFSVFSSKPKVPSGPTIHALLLAYGYVCAYAPVTLLPSRVDVQMLNPLRLVLSEARSAPLKEACVRTIELMGKSMNPSHLKKKHPFAQRDDLVRLLLGYCTPYPASPAEATPPALVAQCLAALSTLVLLDPLPRELESLLVERCLVFLLSSSAVTPTAASAAAASSGGMSSLAAGGAPLAGPSAAAAPAAAATATGFVAPLTELLASILFMDATAACLVRLFKLLEPHSRHTEGGVRERVCELLLALLSRFVDYKKKEPAGAAKPDKRFVEMGRAVSVLVPRCCDPAPAVRRLAIEALQWTLYIDQMLRRDDYALPPPDELRALTTLRDRAVAHAIEPNELYACCAELATLVAQLALPDEAGVALIGCMRGLTDPEQLASAGCCVFLNGVVRARSAELAPRVKELVAAFLSSMADIRSEQTMNGTLHSLRALAQAHLVPVLDELLLQPLPHAPHLVKALQVLAKDEQLVTPCVTHLAHILNNTTVLEEKMDPKTKGRVVTEPSARGMAATVALGELLSTPDLDELVRAQYYLLVCTLLLRFGTVNSFPDASAQAVQCFRAFCAKDEPLQAVMDSNDNWRRVVSADFAASVTELTRAICRSHADELQNMFQFMLPYLKSTFLPQRVVTAAVFAECIAHCKTDKTLLGQLLNSLLASLVDPTVKVHVLVGLGNVAAAPASEANKYAPTVLDALMSAIDDANETVAMDAMQSLAKVFELVDEARVAPTLVNICLRIRPAFEKPHDRIRAAAIMLFGTLHRFGRGQAAHMFHDQIHSNLVALLLHVNDECVAVQQAAKLCLKRLAPLIGHEPLAAYLTGGRVLDENRAVPYEDLLNEVSKLLIAAFPERVNSYVLTCVEYFKSNWTQMRANAAVLVGDLLGNLPVETRRGINLNPIVAANSLILLLKEKSPDVRKKAAFALSLLTTY